MSIRVKEIDKNELLNSVLLNEHNIKEYEIYKNDNGKPYIKDSDVFFSYSTSNSMSAVVTSKNEVGISLKHFFYDEEILNECFNDVEKEKVLNSNKKEYEFTRIYTMKLAYIKMLGVNDINLIDIDTNTLKDWETTSNKDWFASVIYKR